MTKFIHPEPLRAAFKTSSLTKYRLHKMTGINKAGIGRILGDVPSSNVDQTGQRKLQQSVSYENAVKLARALGVNESLLQEVTHSKKPELASHKDPNRKLLAEVDLRPIREAFKRSRLTATEVAQSIGMDKNYVYRLLGIMPFMKYHTLQTGERRRYKYYARSCNYETGVRLAYALGVDPHEVGV